MKTTKTLGATLRPIPGTYRRKIKTAFGAPPGRLTDPERVRLADAIFEVENELEHRSPQHEAVRTMRIVRNMLLDDAGVNELRSRLTAPGAFAVWGKPKYPTIERPVRRRRAA